MARDLSPVPGLAGVVSRPARPAPRTRLIDLRWSELAFALGTLAGVGASFGALIAVLWTIERKAFYLQNALDARVRNLLWTTILAGGIALPAVAFALVLGTRGMAVPSVMRLSARIGPLMLVGLLPSLFAYRIWWSNPLAYMIQLALVVLLAERLTTRCLEATPELFRAAARARSRPWLQRHLPLAVVLLGSVAYAGLLSHFALVNHRLFGTTAFDLGIDVNWAYNALHGRPFRSTVAYGPEGGNLLSSHAIFAMSLWLPFFAALPGPETFLVAQSVLLGLAAIPLYLTAKELLPRTAAVVIALGYLLFAPVHCANLYGLQELPTALPFHFLLYYCIVAQRYRWVPVLVFLLYAHQQDVALGLAILGVFLLVTKARPQVGAALAVVSPLVFVLIRFGVMPWAAGSWSATERYQHLLPPGVVSYVPLAETVLVNPTYSLGSLLKEPTLVYFLHLFAPLAFLPLRRPALALLALPAFLFTLRSIGHPGAVAIGFSYTTQWISYLFLACILALKVLRDRDGAARQWGALLAIALGVGAHSSTFGGVLRPQGVPGASAASPLVETAQDKKLYADFKRLVSAIPENASVAATERELPHVAARSNIYTLRTSHGSADWLLIRAGEAGTIGQDAFNRNSYGVVGQVDRVFYLFKRNHVSPATDKAKGELGIR